MNYKEVFKQARQLSEKGVKRTLEDWRFYAGVTLCFTALGLTHHFVYPLPPLLWGFVVLVANLIIFRVYVLRWGRGPG